MISIAPLSPALTQRLPDQSATSRAQSDFSSILGRSVRNDAQTPEEKARASAEQFVSMTLVQPLLKQLRDSNAAAAPFAPTQGEKQFQSLIDADLAQRMVHKSNFPLVDRLTQDLLKARARLDAAGTNKDTTP